MSDDQKQIFFQNWYSQWIQPEIERRFALTGIPENFRIHQCLVRLPKGREPIVQFNEEFGWFVHKPEMPVSRTLVEIGAGNPIHVSDIIKIENVLPPTVDDERVAFMFLYRSGETYSLFVDFLPNQPDFMPDDERFRFDGSTIATHLQLQITEYVVQWAKRHEAELSSIGLWVAPALFPYPLSKIVENLEKQAMEEARRVFVQYCNPEFIASKLVGTWHHIKIFSERNKFFDDAFFLHKERRYHGSITILLSQVEGVIVEWLYEMISPTKEVARKTPARIEQFRDLLETIPDFTYIYRTAFESLVDLLQEEVDVAKPFQKFTKWLDKINPNFPSRHAAMHGKYVPEIYTEENSIKLFLLLDTICQFMIFYELQVLGRNLSQSSPDPSS